MVVDAELQRKCDRVNRWTRAGIGRSGASLGNVYPGRVILIHAPPLKLELVRRLARVNRCDWFDSIAEMKIEVVLNGLLPFTSDSINGGA